MGTQASRSLAEKLNDLFAHKSAQEGHEVSNEHAAAAITATGVKISQSYVWQLRKGQKDNPTLRHLQALASYFGVPVSYFFDDEVTDRVNAQLAELRAERARLQEISTGSEARLMAMRAGELSPQRRRLVMELLDVVYREEQAARRAPPTT